jgi:hypothetical protein
VSLVEAVPDLLDVEEHRPQRNKPRAKATAVRSGRICAHCGTRTALRSHRRGLWEHLRSKLTGTFPFRCSKCSVREWMPIPKAER